MKMIFIPKVLQVLFICAATSIPLEPISSVLEEPISSVLEEGEEEGSPLYVPDKLLHSAEIAEGVDMRLFGGAQGWGVGASGAPEWENGVKLNYSVWEDGTREGVFADKKLAFLSHGFMSDHKFCLKFAAKFMALGGYQIICLNWNYFANAIKNLGEGKIYNLQARQAVEIGRKLAKALDQFHEALPGSSKYVHLMGHSLGAHLVGNMGRNCHFDVDRVTGFDPAGVDFNSDKSGLREYMIGKDAGEFVDIIHSNAWRNPPYLGSNFPMGHADFYPNGGFFMPECPNPGLVCNHGMSYNYFIESIPDNAFPPTDTRFEAMLCEGPDEDGSDNECQDKGFKFEHPASFFKSRDFEPDNQMGFFATKPNDDDESEAYFLPTSGKFSLLGSSSGNSLIYYSALKETNERCLEHNECQSNNCARAYNRIGEGAKYYCCNAAGSWYRPWDTFVYCTKNPELN